MSITDRTIVLGRTGTGKSVAALNLLVDQISAKSIPWVIIDYKGEDLVNDVMDECQRVKEIKPDFNPKKLKRGWLYRMIPEPQTSNDAVEQFFYKVYKQTHVGLFFDEGYALPKFGKTAGFEIVLTQGRSKHIPCIMLFQRPVWMSVFARAQSNFFYCFPVNEKNDRKTIQDSIEPYVAPDGTVIDIEYLSDHLPDYYALWYDVGRNQTTLLRPAPSPEQVLDKFKSKLGTRKGWT